MFLEITLSNNEIDFDEIYSTLKFLKVRDCNLNSMVDLIFLPNLNELDISRNKVSSFRSIDTKYIVENSCYSGKSTWRKSK